ncbi:MAG: sugar transferase, partial [Coriobacteriia bacterium]|nr:sugar transferase [Coriobacteriia bacterium]
MIKNAEQHSGPVLATEDDPRITALGHKLRKFRIDELPQMLNILRGEMSFIGPRPERPAFVEEYLKEIPGYSERYRIKPGVTGLAQINGGYATTPERKLKYDLMYLYHQSLAFDVQITVETIKVVLVGKGAR